jgi:hypothetical protein
MDEAGVKLLHHVLQLNNKVRGVNRNYILQRMGEAPALEEKKP